MSFSTALLSIFVLFQYQDSSLAFSFVSTRSASSSLSISNKFELNAKKRVVVIGNGMVGQRFMENMIESCGSIEENDLQLVTFCEESRAAYNRVRLTSYFENRKLLYFIPYYI